MSFLSSFPFLLLYDNPDECVYCLRTMTPAKRTRSRRPHPAAHIPLFVVVVMPTVCHTRNSCQEERRIPIVNETRLCKIVTPAKGMEQISSGFRWPDTIQPIGTSPPTHRSPHRRRDIIGRLLPFAQHSHSDRIQCLNAEGKKIRKSYRYIFLCHEILSRALVR